MNKPRGLFLNTSKANCSIHESGLMMYDCLKLSDRYDLDYWELTQENRRLPASYHFYAFNYHPVAMRWLETRSLSRLPGLTATFVLETLRNDPFALCPPNAFDVYCALDPTMNVADKRVYAFPRPLEPAPAMRSYVEPEVPVIGSFGFATPGKGFELVVEAVNREFDRAKVRINIPPGTYADPETFHLHNRDYAEYLTERCQQTAKKGVEVVVTRDYMDKEELIQWCGQNTLNCFLYTRNQPGLSATTDQAISSGRPLAISTNETFRHIHHAIAPYPLRSLKESIALSTPEVLALQHEWEPRNFALHCEKVLDDFHIFEEKRPPKAGTVNLEASLDFGPRLRRLARRVFKKAGVTRDLSKDERVQGPKMRPYSLAALQSYDSLAENLLLDILLEDKEEGFYVEVGVNSPTFESNTHPFYDRGWRGLNLEFSAPLHREFCEARMGDINVQGGVGTHAGKATFYEIPDNPALSSFDQTIAERAATFLGLTITPRETSVRPLSALLDEHAADKSVDLLSIDANGGDLDVLKSNDWKKYRPTLVMVEMNSQPANIMNFMSEREYILLFNNEYNGLFMDLWTQDAHLKSLLEKNYTSRVGKRSSP